jgi:hypothetical protein
MAANDSLEPLDQPDVVYKRLYTSRYRGELFSSRTLGRILMWFLISAAGFVAIGLSITRSGVSFVIGPIAAFAFTIFQGIPRSRAKAQQRTGQWAATQLGKQLHDALATEGREIAAWGAGHGLTPCDHSPVTPIDVTPLLQADAADVPYALEGKLTGRDVEVFGVTQRLSRSSGETTETWFRRLTCVHVVCNGDVSVSMVPKKDPGPRNFGLNRISEHLLGDSWRAGVLTQDSEGQSSDNPLENPEMMQRLVDSGRIPPFAMDVMKQVQAAPDDEARKAIMADAQVRAREWMQQKMTAGIAAQGGGKMGAIRALTGMFKWQPLELESAEFDNRYNLSYQGDKMPVMMLFTPKRIVDLISIQPDDYAFELQHDNLLVARIAPVREPAELDALLQMAEQLAGQVAAPASA